MTPPGTILTNYYNMLIVVSMLLVFVVVLMLIVSYHLNIVIPCGRVVVQDVYNNDYNDYL